MSKTEVKKESEYKPFNIQDMPEKKYSEWEILFGRVHRGEFYLKDINKNL